MKKPGTARERNAAAQRAYRERHGADLKNARRVAYALMGLRKGRRLTDLGEVARALRQFLSGPETTLLRKALTRKRAQTPRDTDKSPVRGFAAAQRRAADRA